MYSKLVEIEPVVFYGRWLDVPWFFARAVHKDGTRLAFALPRTNPAADLTDAMNRRWSRRRKSHFQNHFLVLFWDSLFGIKV